MHFIKLTISFVANLSLNQIIWWSKRTYSTNASSNFGLFSISTGFAAFGIRFPRRVNWKNCFIKFKTWFIHPYIYTKFKLNIGILRRKITNLLTWWFLNTILRWYFAIYDCKLTESVRISCIRWIRAVTWIGIILNINIGINPKRCESFRNAVDENFLDVDLNSNKW